MGQPGQGVGCPTQSIWTQSIWVTVQRLSLYSIFPMAGVVLTREGCQEVSLPDIDIEIAAYESIRAELEARHMGEWVVMRSGKVVGTYGSFEQASSEAVSHFGRGPYLIRQIGAPPITLPASVVYNVING